uniref:Glycosyltransferase family 2 protein n=1 Tax=Dictyoglomus thermophilum TaxID=14 RepID=A0A7C3MKN7_DICTH
MNYNDKVYVNVVYYSGIDDTLKFIESFLYISYPNFQLIIVNNNPQSNLENPIKDWLKSKNIRLIEEYVVNDEIKEFRLDSFLYPLVYIKVEKNLGYANGVNRGIKYALEKRDFSYIWILNNDIIVDNDSLRYLVECAEKYKNSGKKIGIIGSKLLYYYNPNILQGIGGKYNKFFALTKHIGGFEEDKGQYDRDGIKIDYVIGASMFVTKEFLEDVGLMDEQYFLYFEDLDWSERAKRKGYEIIYCWKSKVYHKEGGSIGSDSKGLKKSKLSDFYGIRNRILFTKKFYPLYLPLVYLSFIGIILNRIRRRQIDRLKLIIRAILEKDYRDA